MLTWLGYRGRIVNALGSAPSLLLLDGSIRIGWLRDVWTIPLPVAEFRSACP